MMELKLALAASGTSRARPGRCHLPGVLYACVCVCVTRGGNQRVLAIRRLCFSRGQKERHVSLQNGAKMAALPAVSFGSECVINSARVSHRPLVILTGGGSNVWKVVFPSSNYVAESSTFCCWHDCVCVCVFRFRRLEWLLAILPLSTFSCT